MMEGQSKVERESINVAVPVNTETAPAPQSLRDLQWVQPGLNEKQVSFKIPTNQDAAAHVHEKRGQHSWQAKILKFIHQKWFQRLMIALLVLDILILFTELFLMSIYPMCDIIVRDAISCCFHDESPENRWLASDSHDICEYPTEPTTDKAGCDPHKWHAVHTLESVLFACTIAILSFMMLELLVLMAAITPCVFFRHFWYTLDFIIVSVSLGLEAAFKSIDDDNLASYIGILVIFRCWRFVRISHGLIEVTAELTAEKYEKVVKIAEELEDLMEKHQQKIAADGDCWESESVAEIRKVSKELADQLIATQDEDNDKIHFSHMHLAKSLKKIGRKSFHGCHELDDECTADVENASTKEETENGKNAM